VLEHSGDPESGMPCCALSLLVEGLFFPSLEIPSARGLGWELVQGCVGPRHWSRDSGLELRSDTVNRGWWRLVRGHLRSCWTGSRLHYSVDGDY
jgi:hypothetical protein